MRKNKKPTVSPNTNKTPSPRIWLFRIIMLSMPLMFFILLELGLRLGGYGISLPLFIDTPDSNNYILARPDIIKRYFPKNSDIPTVTMETNFFLKHKPSNAIRIVVQGGSTAAGFPYGFGASPAGLLDQRLQQTFPNRTVEVINTAMSAVSSYTLLDFVDEIIEQKPDAVLIYAGHNEFLGILGVGSTYTAANSHAANLLYLKLKEFRVFQLIQNIFYNVNKPEEENNQQGNTPQSKHRRTMMAKVAKHKKIEINSEIYTKGLAQFRSNMELILAKYKQANIPVLISTIASNLQDQKPFSSPPINQQIAKKVRILIDNLRNKTHLEMIDNQLIDLIEEANQENNALLHFQLGKIYESIKQFKKAKIHYIAAKENDQLRFRAPEAINRIIKELANEYDATIVDYQKILSSKSKNGLVGNNFMLEHLHPNTQGYFVLADSFYQKLKSNNLLGHWKNAVPTGQAWNERPIIQAEEYAGFAKIVQLKSDYPFTNKPIKVKLPKPADWQQTLGLEYFSKKIDWLEMLNRSYQGYLKNRNIPMVLKTSQMIAEAMPQNAKVNFRVGRQLMQQSSPKQARRYFARSVLEEPNNQLYKKYLVESVKKAK